MSPQFPPEILDHITSLAAGSSPTWEQTIHSEAWPYGVNPNATLLSAALVSKAWADSAQRALYRHAIFRVKPKKRTYLAWIESGARARHRTVSLWIRPCEQDLFGRVIETCEGLESLVLGHVVSSLLYVWNLRRKVAWHVLASPCLKDLKSLWLPFPEDFDWIVDTPAAARLPFSLSTLALWFTRREPEEKAFSILFTASQNTLHTLSLYCGPIEPPSTGLSATLPIVAPTIRHLILNVGENSLQDGLAGFDSLEHLEVHPSSHPDPAPSHAHLSATISSLPSSYSLRRLTLGLVQQALLEQLEDVLDYSQLQGLQTLELLERRRYDSFGWDDERLVAACERRSIGLVYADRTV
ncbi:hypothetical protein RQP46_002589 [Phenoliferia psychrophenolica]